MNNGDSRSIVRQANRRTVFTLLQAQGRISQADIVAATGLGKATVSSIIAELATEGWLHEVGTAKATGARGGRRSTLLDINPERGYVVGLKLLDSSLAVVVTDLFARVILHETVPITPCRCPEDVLDIIDEVVTSAIARAGLARTQVLGVGVGISGPIEPGRGTIVLSRNFPDFPPVPMADRLSARLRLPVQIENDVNTVTIAERWFGQGQGCDDFVVVTIGQGIGAGVVVGGRLVRGVRGAAGELGHLRMTPDGPQCECGGQGCLQAVAADPAVVREVRQGIARGEASSLVVDDLTMRQIIKAADEGDKLAQNELARSGAAFGWGVAALINLLAPQKVIVTGEGVDAGHWRLDPMREALRAEVFPPLAGGFTVVTESLDFETWARGAACAVLGRLFDSPAMNNK
ncbi:MAG: ROK family transcriptional regulator [Propionibacteriaceae bacterium]|jgi:predicted NBD/HSP70 family sugar kinase|nr:ROK family transcriptional regulator [Propionibacteriaceae bacterium]